MRAKIKNKHLFIIATIVAAVIVLQVGLVSNVAATHCDNPTGVYVELCKDPANRTHADEVEDDSASDETEEEITINENLQGTRCDWDQDGEDEDGFITTFKYSEDARGIDANGDGNPDRWCNQKSSEEGQLGIEDNPIIRLLNGVIQFMSAGIFIIGILMITVAGFQYITAGGNPEATKAARERIGNVVVGLVLYFFFVAIIEYLVPGGVFG